MIRWKYLLPRIGIVLFLVLLINLLSGPLIRMAVVRSVQSVTGARVDIAEMDVSLWRGTVQIKDLQIADPNNTMENVLQADVADLQLNPSQLLQRRWIVDRARLKRVQFGTPRTESGSLDKNEAESTDKQGSFVVDFVRSQVKSLGREWASQMQASLPGLIEEQLETVRLANELREKWPREFQRHRDNAISLKRRAEALKGEFSRRSDNPLRDLERYRQAVVEARQLVIDFQRAQLQVQNLTNEFQKDQVALSEARSRDRNKILTVTRSISIRPDQLTQLLLSEQQAELIRESVAWLKWFRNSVPDPESDLKPVRARGFDVRFREQPILLIKDLELDGEGQVAGQRVDFGGHVRNISSTPSLVSEPVTFELRGNGAAHVSISGEVDRRGPQKIDNIHISCPQISTMERTLGEADSLVVHLAPGKSSLDINATITDERLSGRILLQQSDVSMKAKKIHEVVANVSSSGESADWLMQGLNQQLQTIDSFQVGIDLSGTLQQPEATLQSDLGERVAAMMSSTFDNSLRLAAESKTRQLETLLNEQVAGLDRLFSNSTKEILGLLTENVTLVADLQQMIKPEGLKLPRFR